MIKSATYTITHEYTYRKKTESKKSYAQSLNDIKLDMKKSHWTTNIHEIN